MTVESCEEAIYLGICTNIFTTNIDSNPLFTDPENGDYTLQADSPCIDSGTYHRRHGILRRSPWHGCIWILWRRMRSSTCWCYWWWADQLNGGQQGCFDVTNDGALNVLDVVVLIDIILGNTTLLTKQTTQKLSEDEIELRLKELRTTT